MMRIDVVTGLPRLLESPLTESIIRRAQEQKHVDIVVHDLRTYATDKHRTIDDTPYGGAAGMIMKAEPVFACIEALQRERRYDDIVYLTPEGEPHTQKLANEFSLRTNLLFLCGHYKGVDERIREALVTREVSIGDYVVTGGELPALVVIDSVVRLIPGVLTDGESLLTDSFQDKLLDAPHYTRPVEIRGMRVPDVLLSGNHKEIAAWCEAQRIKRTRERRKDLLEHS
jgi:tRNA (guanine37-N1)-methyltransferase